MDAKARPNKILLIRHDYDSPKPASPILGKENTTEHYSNQRSAISTTTTEARENNHINKSASLENKVQKRKQVVWPRRMLEDRKIKSNNLTSDIEAVTDYSAQCLVFALTDFCAPVYT
ncbi:zinc finger protein 99-like X3 [Biomphalaria pfeifferi]|uniref:Zinc finger protein 99-like X3 n=1 Tax=Biomphalaria pfeifferi TaxID=112525 RepID=A0AAD8B6E7_BIOPF|nr:zinc finger protein 99-like X3 [Biomphalaria pfeifferi]